MRSFSERQFAIFKQIARFSQTGLRKFLISYLKKSYPNKNVVYSDHYIYAKGEIPVALVAHMDTVHKHLPEQIYWDRKEDIVWSPQGLGADDRAGVFAILQIIAFGYKPHIIFTADEEIGGIGASLIAERGNPFDDLRYVIEFDRRGLDDCVFYDCDNPDFTEYISCFGFKKEFGSYSDICEFCPDWGVAGVNLSVGYFNEHTLVEYLIPSILLDTISKVCEMLDEDIDDIPFFEYIPKVYNINGQKFISSTLFNRFSVICRGCGEAYLQEEVIPVRSRNGSTVFYCPDCIVDNVEWCVECEKPFEKTSKDDINTLCEDCRARRKNK